VEVGPLPDDVDSLAFPAIQTYEGNEEVAWIEPTPEGGEEPEHPAPVLELVDAEEGDAHGGEATDETSTTTSDDDVEVSAQPADDEDTDTLTIVALIAGIAGVILGAVALVSARRRSTAT
jgi:uncharacterized protein